MINRDALFDDKMVSIAGNRENGQLKGGSYLM
jgi:hypothetical protein